MSNVKLLSGHEMPMLGLGTWDLRRRKCKKTLKKALDLGYNHIDTAWMYNNQREIGDTLRESGVDRSKLFITSKVWRTHLHYDGVLQQFDETINDLQTDYVDLFLIHWPDDSVPMTETFRALKHIFDQGKVRSIGVSNFNVDQMIEAEEVSEVPVSVNQIKYHMGSEQRDVLSWCLDHKIAVTAYTPLGRKNILKNSTLNEIAKSHGKKGAQVALRWLVQKEMIVIPKASSGGHLKENMDLFDWSLSSEEMKGLDNIT